MPHLRKVAVPPLREVADLVPPLVCSLSSATPQLRSLHLVYLKLQRMQRQQLRETMQSMQQLTLLRQRHQQCLHPRRSQSASLIDPTMIGDSTMFDRSPMDVDSYCCVGNRNCSPNEKHI